MLGRSFFRLLLLLYPSWFRNRFGVEMLAEFDASRARRPGPALIAILALGLGIGLTTGMFSIANGVILKGLPVEDPHELMALNRINPSEGQGRLVTRIHDYTDLRDRQTTFEGLAAYEITTFNLASGDGPPDFVSGANVTTNTFRLLRTAPVLGREFAEGDDLPGAQSVALIGYRFWQDRFNGARTVSGALSASMAGPRRSSASCQTASSSLSINNFGGRYPRVTSRRRGARVRPSSPLDASRTGYPRHRPKATSAESWSS